MYAFLLRRKATALIWQYLDGVIPPDRFELLQRLLNKHSGIRRQFVDCAMLNALLFAYFNPGRYSAEPSPDGRPKLGDVDAPSAADAFEADLVQPPARRR